MEKSDLYIKIGDIIYEYDIAFSEFNKNRTYTAVDKVIKSRDDCINKLVELIEADKG